MEIQQEASTSTPTRPLCSVCYHKYAIYTCPRCSTKTCSLPCSSTHKTAANCSGERDKVRYVPMKEYGWGAMMGDYAYLEDVGRHVGEWGKGIAEIGMNTNTRGTTRGRGRGRGGGAGGGAGNTRRDILKGRLERLDINMDLLPVGMEKRKLNQSGWDNKTQTPFLTIEYKFISPPEPPFTLLTHRNNLSSTLQTLARTQVSAHKKTCPSWLGPLLSPEDPEEEPEPPKYRLLPIRHLLDPSQPLLESLRDLQFVEFPTIQVSWQDKEEEPVRKRRKVDKKAMSGLLGGYGSDESDVEEKEPKVDGLTLLGRYEGSDDEEDEGDDDEGEMHIDHETLMVLVREAQMQDVNAEEEIDWGESDEDED